MASTADRLRAERARRRRAARARARERRRLAACRRRQRRRGRSTKVCRKRPTAKTPPKTTTPKPPKTVSVGPTPTPTAAPVRLPATPVKGPSAPSAAQPVRPPATIPGSGGHAPSTPTTPTTPTTPSVPSTSTPWGPVTFGREQATRLLWRAGFGPKAGDVDRLLALGLEKAVDSLVDPPAAKLTGPEPHDQDDNALDPTGTWGHDQLWWLDRMVRSNQPLVERMTLVWHDWFATSRNKIGEAGPMLRQNATQRELALGSFPELLREMTRDPAMLAYLDGRDNTKWTVNENYGREVMELFTLGANRGAYTENDVRQIARAFAGLQVDRDEATGEDSVRLDPDMRVVGSKTIFGKTGDFDWQDACRLLVEHDKHASFFVTKLWSAFVPTAPDAKTLAELQRIYLAHDREIKPVVRAILLHPDLHHGQTMVKPPAVYVAGMLRALNRYIDTGHWSWCMDQCGQVLFSPPNVAGWDDTRWMNSATWRGRFTACAIAVEPFPLEVWSDPPYSATETPQQALTKALAFWGNPPISTDVRSALLLHGAEAVTTLLLDMPASPARAFRQNGLRLLLGTSSDAQTS